MAAVFSSVLAIIALAGEPGGVGLPLGIPPGPQDPVIARVAPEKCLLYVNWAGTASPDPKSPSETERFLAEPEVQHFLVETGRAIDGLVRQAAGTPSQVVGKGKPKTEQEKKESAELAGDGLDWLHVVLTHPTAIFLSDVKVSGKKSPPVAVPTGSEDQDVLHMLTSLSVAVHGGMVVSLGPDAARVKASVEKHLAGFLRPNEYNIVERLQIRGQPWYRVKPAKPSDWPNWQAFTWGFHGDYFVAGLGDGSVEAILERMEKNKQPPAWLTAAETQVPVPRRTGIIYLDLKNLQEALSSWKGAADVKAVWEMLGLDNATALIHTVGLDERGFVNKVLLAIDGPPRGLLRLVSDRPLRPEDLAPIPRDATLALAVRLDVKQALDIVLSALEKMSPETRATVNQTLDHFEHDMGVDIRRGLLPSLGDTWCIYNSPGEGGLVLTGLTAVVPLRKNPGFDLAYTKLLDVARKNLPAEPDAPFNPATGVFRHFTFAGREICYAYVSPPFAPAWCITPTELVVALNPHNVKAYLSRREHKSLATVPEVAEVLSGPDRPVMVGYCDTPKLFELFYPLVSMYAPAICALADGAKIDLDPSFWPSAPSIAPHLRRDVTTLERTRHGIQITCRYCLPTGGVTGPLWMAAVQPVVSLMPAYSGDPARRTQELTYTAEPAAVPVAPPPAPAPAEKYSVPAANAKLQPRSGDSQ
jgi:hypothetical protein